MSGSYGGLPGDAMIPKEVWTLLGSIACPLDASRAHKMIPKGMWTILGIIACPLDGCRGHAFLGGCGDP